MNNLFSSLSLTLYENNMSVLNMCLLQEVTLDLFRPLVHFNLGACCGQNAAVISLD